ncbi:MAG TPA: hypothetical protein VES19_17375 [Candidatus Limnocylindrales bacterium]|nr:hypothetical protein [Candidatus Limnocylindrales bacterium]
MQVIAVSSSGSLADRLAAARSFTVAILLLIAGVALALLCLATPLVSSFIPDGRPTTMEVASGILVWGFAIVLPGAFLVLGLARMASLFDSLSASRPRRVTPHLAQALGPDHLAATDLVLPGGRRVHELVLGPFGMAVLGDVPPRSSTRHVGARWEIRDDRGRWIPIENPVQRTSRDAERVRGWLAANDRDFLVRVYAVIVTDDPTMERSPTCAVVTAADLAGWLEALPAQRGLTPQRREQLTARVRDLAAASTR